MRRMDEDVVVVVINDEVVKPMRYRDGLSDAMKHYDNLINSDYEVYISSRGGRYIVTSNEVFVDNSASYPKFRKMGCTQDLVRKIHRAPFIKHWTNLGMPKQLEYTFLVKNESDTMKDAIGSVYAISHDNNLAFEINKETATVKYCKQTISFHDSDGLSSSTLAHIFCESMNTLNNNGYVTIPDELLYAFKVVNTVCKTSIFYNNLIFVTSYNPEEYCNEITVYTKECAKKFHIGKEYDKYSIAIAYSEKSAIEICREENYFTNMQFEECWMRCPDGSVDKDMGIVCYKLM